MILKRSSRAFWRKVDLPAAVVFVIAIFAAVGLATGINAVLDRAPPIEYLDASAGAESAPAGSMIDIHFDVFRFRICPVVKTSRVLTDSQGTQHAVSNYTIASNTRPGREVYDRTITIPEAAAPGIASYRIQITYACNFVHNLGWPIEVLSPPVFFRVTPSETEGFGLPPPELEPPGN